VEEELACRRWLSMNDNVACRKILKCVTVKQIQILSLRGNTEDTFKQYFMIRVIYGWGVLSPWPFYTE
jgi:uncharacterized membrane protein